MAILSGCATLSAASPSRLWDRDAAGVLDIPELVNGITLITIR
jgi:hypothetical protein